MTSGISKDIKTVVKSLKANRFESVEFVEKPEAALKTVLDMIPPEAKVGVGGSMTLRQIGLIEGLEKRGNIVNRRLDNDIFLTSSNAITLDGKLVNIDMVGNRVAGMIYGLKKVIVVAGINKLVRNVDEALDRIKNVISPYHAMTMGVKTPCAVEGRCTDCKSPQRICNVTTIIEKRPARTDFTIVLVGEDLGLGWDPTWPEERREKIAAAYRGEMQKLRASYQQTRP